LILYDTTLKVSQEQIRKECDLIIPLQEANLKDPEIINQLQIDRRTFCRHKKRIEKEDAINATLIK
jgi:hypothetical protein